MKNISKQCQKCKESFEITIDDQSFYEKINVPTPTFCPKCRLIRRFAATNERVLFKRRCDLTGKDIFAMYPEDTVFPVYETDAWYSDDWDPHKYGMEYDFSRSFFEQFKELQKKVPRMSLVKQGFSTNSSYTHRVTDMKNSFMVFRVTKAIDSFYTYIGRDIVNCSDCFEVSSCELCYECIDCDNCFKVKYSQESSDCRDSSFMYSCRNCTDCTGCVNLVNQQYCIFNKKYTKEEYYTELEKLKLNTASGIKIMEEKFDEFRRTQPQRSIASIKSENVSGNWFLNAKNVKNSFWCQSVKDGNYLFSIYNAEDCMDYFQWGNNAELVYESSNCGINISRIFFSAQCWSGSHDLYYCDSCPGLSNSFGCIGVKRGEYSILNKKYSKQEYEEMLPRIIEQMKEVPYIDKNGLEYKFGEFFPEEMSDFGYNITAAGDFFPLDKDEALTKNYKWEERDRNEYQTTTDSSHLPETISEVSDEILNEIIECADKDNQYSVGAFKITPNELSFYRRMDIPLPRSCFDVRHMKRFNKRPPPNIIHRNCSKCGLNIETVYTEDYAPILYCGECYQQTVY